MLLMIVMLTLQSCCEARVSTHVKLLRTVAGTRKVLGEWAPLTRRRTRRSNSALSIGGRAALGYKSRMVTSVSFYCSPAPSHPGSSLGRTK